MPEESELADLLNEQTWCNKVAFLADISQALITVCSKRMKIFLLVLKKLTLLRKK
jgi:Tfp pilus assembly protein PilN